MLRIATSAIAIATVLTGFAGAAQATRFNQPGVSAAGVEDLTPVSNDDRRGHGKHRHGDDDGNDGEGDGDDENGDDD